MQTNEMYAVMARKTNGNEEIYFVSSSELRCLRRAQVMEQEVREVLLAYVVSLKEAFKILLSQ